MRIKSNLPMHTPSTCKAQRLSFQKKAWLSLPQFVPSAWGVDGEKPLGCSLRPCSVSRLNFHKSMERLRSSGSFHPGSYRKNPMLSWSSFLVFSFLLESRLDFCSKRNSTMFSVSQKHLEEVERQPKSSYSPHVHRFLLFNIHHHAAGLGRMEDPTRYIILTRISQLSL